MTIERALYSYLTSDAEVAALIATRLYPETAPTERLYAFPYITYTQPARQNVYAMNGFTGLSRASFTLDVWTDSQPSREAVARVVEAAVHAWAPDAREGVAIRRATVEQQADDYVPPTDGSERGTYQRAMDVDVWFKEL